MQLAARLALQRGGAERLVRLAAVRLRLDPGELAEFLARAFAVEPGGDEQLAYGFRRLDADGDGRISSDELQAAALARTTPCGELQGLARRVGERPGASLGFGTFLRAVDSRRGGFAPGAQ